MVLRGFSTACLAILAWNAATAQVPIADSAQHEPKSDDAKSSSSTAQSNQKTVTLSNGLVCNVVHTGGTAIRQFKGAIPRQGKTTNDFTTPSISLPEGSIASSGAGIVIEVLTTIGAALTGSVAQLPVNGTSIDSTVTATGTDALHQDAWDRNTAARVQASQVWNQAIETTIGLVQLFAARNQSKLIAMSEAAKLVTYTPTASDPFAKDATPAPMSGTGQQTVKMPDGGLKTIDVNPTPTIAGIQADLLAVEEALRALSENP